MDEAIKYRRCSINCRNYYNCDVTDRIDGGLCAYYNDIEEENKEDAKED